MTAHPSNDDVTRLTEGRGPRDPAELLAGRASSGGRYRLGLTLGQGGMAIVVEAEDVALRRVVALKRLRPELRRDGITVQINTSDEVYKTPRVTLYIDHESDFINFCNSFLNELKRFTNQVPND